MGRRNRHRYLFIYAMQKMVHVRVRMYILIFCEDMVENPSIYWYKVLGKRGFNFACNCPPCNIRSPGAIIPQHTRELVRHSRAVKLFTVPHKLPTVYRYCKRTMLRSWVFLGRLRIQIKMKQRIRVRKKSFGSDILVSKIKEN